MNNNSNVKKTTMLSPTLTVVLAIVTLMGIYFLQSESDDNFYITAFFMVLAVLGMIGASIATAGIKGYGYPRKITLRVIAWRYFLTQYIVSLIFTLVPLAINFSFKIELKRYLITHMAVLGLFSIAAILLVTGKRQMDEAKQTAMHQLETYIQELREIVRVKVAGKENRVLVINELDELSVVVSAANPVYSDTLAYIESEIKHEFAMIDECINKIINGNEEQIDVLVKICQSIKKKFQQREEIIQTEIDEE